MRNSKNNALLMMAAMMAASEGGFEDRPTRPRWVKPEKPPVKAGQKTFWYDHLRNLVDEGHPDAVGSITALNETNALRKIAKQIGGRVPL